MIEKLGTGAIIAGSIVLVVGAAPIIFGFGTAGIVAGSSAAVFQAGIGNVVAGSAFATATSLGMTGTFLTTTVVGGVTAGAGIISKIFKH